MNRIPQGFKPLLAAKIKKEQTIEEFHDVIRMHLRSGPLGCTPKIDGIRCFCYDTHIPGDCCRPLTRSLKDIPNLHVRNELSKYLIPGYDGELVCGTSFQAVTSGIMSEGGKPDFTYYVFDFFDNAQIGETYFSRTDYLAKLKLPSYVTVLKPKMCRTLEEILAYDEENIKNGAEGTMLRVMNGGYKFGRSTQNEGILIALKQFMDGEAKIIGFEELMHNNNPPSINELGYQERSTHKANMSPGNTLGALIVRDIETGCEFNIGSGFDAMTRQLIWNSRPGFLGKIVKYKHQPHGRKDAPRIPIFLGIRDPRDMDAVPQKPTQGELI